MDLYGREALQRIRAGKLALGLGVHHLRGSAVPLLAKAAGYDWLFIDAEHGAISTPEIAQIAMAALPMGVVPIVRICTGALDEGTRALDNGALGIVVPHVDTPEQARGLVEAFRFSPIGHRSTGGSNACFGYRPPSAAEAQKTLNAQILVVAMIETPRAVENAKAAQPEWAGIRSGADGSALVEGVDHEVRGVGDVVPELGVELGRQVGGAEPGAEVGEPVVLGGRRHLERRVAHPQPWMPAALGVRRRAAPVLDQEQGEPLLGRPEVLLGVQRP